jgi:hypothetical protein
VTVIVVSPEEAEDGAAEFWCGGELVAVTVYDEGRLGLRIDPRGDGLPWILDVESLARGLVDARQQISAY